MQELIERARILRIQICDLARKGHGYHFGGTFSCVEILVTLYKKILQINDKFLLGKGHAVLALYPLLQDCGYDPQINDHPFMDCSNGIFCTSGSLGLSLPFGTGMALAKKLQNKKGRIFVLLGEAECQEGTTWESLLIASQHKLDNLIVIIDKNNYQGSGCVDDILSLGNLEEKLRSFGCYVKNVNGHSHNELLEAYNGLEHNKCNAIIAHTIKGKGAKIMEKDPASWHGKFPTEEQFREIYSDLGENYEK